MNAQNDSLKNSTFESLEASYKKMLYTNTSQALSYAIKAKEIALTSNNHTHITKAYYYIANCYYNMGANSDALQPIELALANSTDSTDIVLLYNVALLHGHILSELGEDSKALKAYVKAQEYAEEINNPEYEISVLTNIAYIKKIHKDFQEAINMYKTVLQKLETLEESQNNNVYKAIALMNIADTYLWLQKTDDASYYNEQGLKLSSRLNMELLHHPMLMNKAIIYYQKEVYGECIKLAKQIATLTKDDEKKSLHLTALFYLGKSSYKLKNYEEAIAFLEEVLQAINSSSTVDVNEKELHEFLALLYNKVGNAEKNLFHFKKYVELEKKQSAEDLKINNETHELVDLVSVQSEIREIKASLADETNSKRVISIVALLLLVLLIISSIYYKRKGRIIKQKFDKLLEKVTALEKEETSEKAVPKKEKVTDAKAAVILEKIDAFEKRESYLSTECSLGFMAEKLETNTSYLSKVINKYKKKTFTAYITELRINNSLIRLKNDKTLQSYTIKAIAEEFGFKRQETFSKAFKAQTGIYPSQYLKKLRKNR